MPLRFSQVPPVLLVCLLLLAGAVTAFSGDEAWETSGPAEVWIQPVRDRTDPILEGRPPVWEIGPVEDLPNTAVQTVAVDAKGYLWGGTEDGAILYNGRDWTTVNMPQRNISNFVHTVVRIGDSVYFGTDGTLNRWRDGQWIESYDAAKGLPGKRIVAVLEWAQPGGEGPDVWIGSEKGVAKLRNGAWIRYGRDDGLPDDVVTCMQAVSSRQGGEFLYAGTERGLARFDGKSWKSVPMAGTRKEPSISSILPVAFDDGREELWVSTTTDGVFRLADGQWTAITAEQGLPHNFVYCLAETIAADGSRTIWTGTHSGLARASLDRFQGFSLVLGVSTEALLPYSPPSSSNVTQTLLIGTSEKGMLAMPLGLCTVLDKSAGLLDSYVWTLYHTTNAFGDPVVWIGSYTGLAKIERGTWTRYYTSWENPGNTIRSLLETDAIDGGRSMLVGTWKGLGIMEGNQIVPFPIPSDASEGLRRCLTATVYTMTEGIGANGDKEVWVGGRDGLARFSDGKWTYFDIADGLPDRVIRALLATKDRDGQPELWVGTDFGGVARYKAGVWTGFNTQSGVPNESVQGMTVQALPDGRVFLWIGTFGGAAYRDLYDDAAPWIVLSDDPASDTVLPNNVIYQVEIDGLGQIYLFTSKGAVRLRRTSDTVPFTFESRTFTTEEGLLSNEYNSGGSDVDRFGRVWAGSVNGIAVFDPKDEIVTGASPLQIERVFLGSQAATIAGANLRHDENNLSFEYTLLNFYRKSDTRYRSQLVGFERDATDWAANYRRDFTNLPAGEYTFRVWARDYAGQVAGPAEVTFKIRPAIWNTWAAYLLYVAVALSLTLGFIRLRTRALKRSNLLLERKVSERTAEIARQAEQLRESEARAHAANRAKSVFLANMSHELRTPLNAVIGFAQLLGRDRSLASAQRESVSAIAYSGEHLLGLINDVLSISKIEAGKTTLNESTFDLRSLLEGLREVTAARARAKGIELRFEVAEDLPRHVTGDEGKVRQILLNLLGNAVKFTSRGSVTVRAGCLEDGLVRFDVEDTGAGIEEHEMESLFEPFAQTETGRQSNEGTGLGLAISRSFARLMSGDITVVSERGKGTVFTVVARLRSASDAAHAATMRRAIGHRGHGSPVSVLIVDDNALNRTVLVKLFQSVGFRTQEAANGAEAVEMWETQTPDLILMDVRMPGIDGVEATRRIREAESRQTGDRRRTAIIACSASVFEQDRETILAAGCDDFIPKPFREHTLFEATARALGIEFLFEETEAAPEFANGPAERLTDLPAPLLAKLDRALKVGDMQLTLSVINEIETHAPKLAAHLRGCASRYEVDGLIDLVEAALSSKT